MRREEATAVADLAGDAVAGLTTQVRDVHRGVAKRVFKSIGTVAMPVQVGHDLIAGGVYSGVRRFGRTVVRDGSRMLGATRPPDAPSIEEAPAGRAALALINGVVGDTLQRQGSPLALEMTLRHRGRAIEPTREQLADVFPDATPKMALFAHGLCQTEGAWRRGAERSAPYGPRLQDELGYTPLYIRYSTGRHISENGRDLASLLDRVAREWPVEVEEIVLIGHAMGALVCRSACHYGYGSPWSSKVRHVFTLAAPHQGTPLERIAGGAAAALARVPETRAFARALNLRSAGIKDLRHGYLIDEDWAEQGAGTRQLTTGHEVPYLPSANHYFVSASLSRDPDSRLGRVVGDLVVQPASAWGQRGRGSRTRFPVDRYRHLGGASHLDLLNHPAVYEQLRDWLSRPQLPAPAAQIEPPQRP